MKLTKNKLLKLAEGKLVQLGYSEFKDTRTGSSGLFVKIVNEKYFLTLGLEISRLYDARFTASYYLSKTTRWGAVWLDIPKESYERVGKYLTKEERKLLLDAEFNRDGVIDAWWHENEIDKFFQTIELTEARFLNQENLFFKIENSIEVQKLSHYSSCVIKSINEGRIDESFNYQFIPEKSIDNVPLIWFKAAEVVLLNESGILNSNTVTSLASDTWRQYELRKSFTLHVPC